MNQMNQAERRLYLIRALLDECGAGSAVSIPAEAEAQRQFLRALFNTRHAAPASDEFLKVQDDYLKEEIARKGITDADALNYSADGIAVWRGDITTLKIDAIVNAANSALRGCFIPCHSCVDNIIHSVSGIQLRLACDKIMNVRGRGTAAVLRADDAGAGAQRAHRHGQAYARLQPALQIYIAYSGADSEWAGQGC